MKAAAMIALMLPSLCQAATLAGPFVNPSNGHSYTLLTSNTWTASEAEAITLGGHLATIRNQSENNWLLSTFQPFLTASLSSLLIGFTDPSQDGNFVWISGAPVTFTNWGQGEPNNLTSEIYTNLLLQDFNQIVAGQWNNINNGSASLPQHGVVEVVPEPAVGALALMGLVTVLPIRRRRVWGEQRRPREGYHL